MKAGRAPARRRLWLANRDGGRQSLAAALWVTLRLAVIAALLAVPLMPVAIAAGAPAHADHHHPALTTADAGHHVDCPGAAAVAATADPDAADHAPQNHLARGHGVTCALCCVLVASPVLAIARPDGHPSRAAASPIDGEGLTERPALPPPRGL